MGAATRSPRPSRADARAAVHPATPRLVQGQVYSYIKDGVRHYTSKPPKGVLRCDRGPHHQVQLHRDLLRLRRQAGRQLRHAAPQHRRLPERDRAARASEFGVDEAIVRAIIHAESAFNPNALSRVGAQGLMQLMPATARRFGVSNAFDAGQNIRGGVQYLAWLLKRFNGNLTLAAAGYNAGEGAVDRHGGVPPYSETHRYVERVGVLADRYRGSRIWRQLMLQAALGASCRALSRKAS